MQVYARTKRMLVSIVMKTGKNLNNFPCVTGYSSMNDVKKIRDLKSHAWAP
jgi:hypothetical protein